RRTCRHPRRWWGYAAAGRMADTCSRPRWCRSSRGARWGAEVSRGGGAKGPRRPRRGSGGAGHTAKRTENGMAETKAAARKALVERPARDGRPLGGLDRESLHELLYQMLLGRRFEEKCAEAYALGKIGGFLHLYIGQEAVAVGATSVLRPDDYVISAYREHVHALAKGMT